MIMKKRMAVILAIVLLAVSAGAVAEGNTEQAGPSQGQTQGETAGGRTQVGGRQDRQGPGKVQTGEADTVSGATQTQENWQDAGRTPRQGKAPEDGMKTGRRQKFADGQTQNNEAASATMDGAEILPEQKGGTEQKREAEDPFRAFFDALLAALEKISE